MTDFLQISQRVRFVPNYVPGMRQPALQVCLTMQGATAHRVCELSASLEELISVELPRPEALEQEWHSDAPLPHQFASVISQCFRWIMRASGIPVFGRSLICDVEPLATHIFLPCPAGLHLPAAAVVQWLLRTANIFLADKPLLPQGQALALLVKRLATQAPPGLNTIRFLESAYLQGIPLQKITGTTYLYGWGARARWFDSSFTDVTPVIASNLARDKFATAAWLQRAGLPVPKHQFSATEEEAVQVAARLGYPVVVKPSDMDGGVGVSAGLRNDAQVIIAYRAAKAVSKKILVEKHFEGNDYRLQVLNGKVFWAVHRVPGGVEGDGSSSVLQLLDRLNADPVRGARGSSALLKQIDLDEEAQDLLVQQDLTPESTPAAGQFVRLRRAANVASGGRPVPVLDVAHPDNLKLAERAARLLRLDLAGVDLLIPDIRQSWLTTGAAICEVNAQPQLSPHLPGLILEKLVKNKGRIPVVLVMGSSVNPSPGLSLAASLSRSGLVVGFASRQRSFVGNPTHLLGVRQTLQAAESLLMDPQVEVAVIHLDAGDLSQPSLPVDQCSAVVLLGDPASGAKSSLHLREIQNIVAQCTGTVFCEMPPAAWGLPQAENIQQATEQAATQSITSLACEFWKDELVARRRRFMAKRSGI
jgi:cyanophycin synthetase